MLFVCCRKKKCACPSCYCSNCSRALCYCSRPRCSPRWPSCCWNRSSAFCYCWDCSQKGLCCRISNMYAPYPSTLLAMLNVRPRSTFSFNLLIYFIINFFYTTLFTNSMKSMSLCQNIIVWQFC